jgi:NAD(P)H dehydrogenase (quinone)
MPRILVLFHSRTGRTSALADAIAEGAKSVRFAEVDVRRVEDLASEEEIARDPAWRESRDRLRTRYRTLDDAASLGDYEGIVVGSPSRLGIVSAELARLLQRLAPFERSGTLANRVGSAFAPAAEGGRETTLWSVLTPMARLGLILVPPLPAIEGEAGEIAAAREHGRRVATVVEWVAHAKSHAHGHGAGHAH